MEYLSNPTSSAAERYNPRKNVVHDLFKKK
jgi:hypothetical protein